MQRIPKIIHYCWLSGEPFPGLIQKCMDSWKEILTDYEFILWDTDRFDVNSCEYVKQAYQEKKYAFASDYIRLYALYHYGGIYLDSDILVYKRFDDLLENRAFLGFETNDMIAGWIMASEKGNPLFRELLDYYHNRNFVFPDGHYDLTPNGNPITEICKGHGLMLNNAFQDLGTAVIFPRTYFCPSIPDSDMEECYSSDTYAQHMFNAGWIDMKQKKMLVRKREIQKKYGTALALLYYGAAVMKEEGIFSFIRRWEVRRKNRKLSGK